LQSGGIRTHLVVSKSALQTLKEEADFSFEQVRALAETTYTTPTLAPQSPRVPSGPEA
jgi:3-polyprenyl-4-hydroxybenzoate decarboxylase